jgi:hypothetical protein
LKPQNYISSSYFQDFHKNFDFHLSTGPKFTRFNFTHTAIMTADTGSRHSPLTEKDELAMNDSVYIEPPPWGSVDTITSNTSNPSSNSTPSVTVRIIETPAVAATTLPDELYSIQTLQEMGFIRPVAEEIFSKCSSRDEQDPANSLEYAGGPLEMMDPKSAQFITYALGHLAMLDEDKPPREAMTALGITEELQEALTDPEFEQLFDSATLYWLEDTMRMRFNSVDTRQRQVRRGEQGNVARLVLG